MKKSSQHSMPHMQVLHNFILFFLKKYFSSQHQKTKNEDITYNGPIILWWSLNGNGPRFCNTLIIKLRPIGIEVQKNQV